MDELREALRDGLREEAMTLNRRVAEIKGLSNNTIRRLAGIEATLEAERNARLDALAVMIELLTEGWRAMAARVERIAAAIESRPSNVVPLVRETA